MFLRSCCCGNGAGNTQRRRREGGGLGRGALCHRRTAATQQLFGNNARRGHIPMKWVKFGLAKDIYSRKVWRIKRVYRDDPRVRPPQCQKQAKSFPKGKTNQVAVRSDTCDACTMYDCALRGEPTQDAPFTIPGHLHTAKFNNLHCVVQFDSYAFRLVTQIAGAHRCFCDASTTGTHTTQQCQGTKR
jgi:hypothetical protein